MCTPCQHHSWLGSSSSWHQRLSPNRDSGRWPSRQAGKQAGMHNYQTLFPYQTQHIRVLNVSPSLFSRPRKLQPARPVQAPGIKFQDLSRPSCQRAHLLHTSNMAYGAVETSCTSSLLMRPMHTNSSPGSHLTLERAYVAYPIRLRSRSVAPGYCE